MSDSIELSVEDLLGLEWPLIPREPSETDPRFIKHVRCEGSRVHVLRWDVDGCHCSELDCIVNRRS
jgi:hypothetical protein